MPIDITVSKLDLDFSEDKDSPEYGKEMVKKINNILTGSLSGYFQRRNERFADNRIWAEGKYDMQPFFSIMGVDPRKSYIRLDPTPPKILNKYIEQIVTKLYNIEESASFKAIDIRSNAQRERDRKEAIYRMKNQAVIAQIQQASGLQVENQDDFTPDSSEALDLYFSLQYQLPEETVVESETNDAISLNDKDVIKRQILYDICVCGLGVSRSYIDRNGNKVTERLKPESLFYSYCQSPDFKDAWFIGHSSDISISDFRKWFGQDMDEKEIYDIAKRYSAREQETTFNFGWTPDYYKMNFRPYDECTIPLMRAEVKTNSTFFVKERKSKTGSRYVDFYERPVGTESENVTVRERNVDTIYVAYWIRGTDKMLAWRRLNNPMRPQSNLSRQLFTYSPYMPQGIEMENTAIPEKAKSSVFQMVLAYLKIQQLIAKMRPAGYIYDIAGLQDVVLSDNTTLKPLQMQAYHQQTGDFYYNSILEDGTQRVNPPITPSPNNEATAQIQQLIQVYNFYLERLMQDMGTNPAALGQPLGPRMGLGVIQAQVSSAGNSISYIFEAWMNIFSGIAKRFSIMCWNDIIFGISQITNTSGRPINKGSWFDVYVKVKSTDEDRQFLQQSLIAALNGGSLPFSDVYVIKNIGEANPKLAQMYLSRKTKEYSEQAARASMQRMQENMQVQAQAAQSKTQGDLEKQQMKGKIDLIKQEAKDESKEDELTQKYVSNALLASQKNNAPLEGMGKAIVEKYLAEKMGIPSAMALGQMLQQQNDEQNSENMQKNIEK